MRVAIAIPHFWRPDTDRRYGATRDTHAERLAAVKGCLETLRATFGRDHQANLRQPNHSSANDTTSVELDTVVCVHNDDHLISDLGSIVDDLEIVQVDSDPMRLGFACHDALYSRLEGYQYFGYIEDDILIRDPWMFEKLSWFKARFGEDAVLQPNRYEISRQHIGVKVYVDGDLEAGRTIAFQDVSRHTHIQTEYLGRRVRFHRFSNPHSGCFFLSADQMRTMRGSSRSNGASAEQFFSPLEEAATLALMKTFRVYKPHPQNASFCEVEHFGDAWIRRIESRDARMNATPLWLGSSPQGLKERTARSNAPTKNPLTVGWAIHYHSSAFEPDPEKPAVSSLAGEGLLRAIVNHASTDTIHCLTPMERQFRRFARTIHEAAPGRMAARWVKPIDMHGLGDAGCLLHPSMAIAKCAWSRLTLSAGQQHSIVGVSTALSSHRAMVAISGLALAPLFPWDAIICTSSAVKAAIQSVLERWSDYLSSQLGATAAFRGQLPVIPIGVDCARFLNEDWDRSGIRNEWGIPSNAVVFLYVGRLGSEAKINLTALFRTLQQTAKRSKEKVCLALLGWFNSDKRRRRIFQAAADVCPDVLVVFRDGRDSVETKKAWRAADVFTLLSDNIQDTVDLTIMEAMAAGLPTVCTDWGGHRELVRHGQDGFLVSTMFPERGARVNLGVRHECGIDNYEEYLGKVSQTVHIDTCMLSEAFRQLIEDETLRRQMGASAQRRARELYDWPVVIKRYEDLFSSLNQIRKAKTERPLPASLNPLRDDPFTTFAGYPTQKLSAATKIQRNAEGRDLDELLRDPLTNFGMVARGNVAKRMLNALSQDRVVGIGELLGESWPEHAQEISWLIKHGLILVRSRKNVRPEPGGATKLM